MVLLPTNSSQSDTLQVKSPHSCKTPLNRGIYWVPYTNQLGNLVKHLLILLSLLLLTSPVIGQETGVLYLLEISSGKVWKSFGDKDTQPKYKGQVENGKPNGQETYTNPDGDMYEGEFKDGVKHGQGTYTLTDGNRFEGEWKDGKPWNLTIYDKNGITIGKWVNGVLQK